MKKNFATLVAGVALAFTSTAVLAAPTTRLTASASKASGVAVAPARVTAYSVVELPQECTATATVTIAGQSISLSATASTCAEALKMLRDTIKDL